MRRFRRHGLIPDTSGAAAIEFAFVAFSLVLFTFAILDFGFALYWFNRAEKATQLGARIAAVSDPVAPGLTAVSGITPGSTAGEACEAPDGSIQVFCQYDPDPIICTSNSCNGYGFNVFAFNKIVNAMRAIYPQLRVEDVRVEYRSSPLGFAARPGNAPNTFNIVPMVTVRVTGLEYEYVALGALLGLAPFTLPDISASLTGEDLDSSTSL